MTENPLPTGPFAFQEWRQRVGIEREYKWSFPDAEGDAILAGQTVAEVLRLVPLPPGYGRRRPYRHHQSTAYLDDRWRLLGSEASLAVVVNTGPTGRSSYLKAKQTVSWEDLRRDAVEIAEKIDADGIELAVSGDPVLPVRYLLRQHEAGLVPAPFATTEQDRWKMGVVGPGGTPVMVSWDRCTIRAVDTGREEVVHCIEAETNAMDGPGRQELAAMAAAVSTLLGREPDRLSKSRRAAALCGCPLAVDPPDGGWPG